MLPEGIHDEDAIISKSDEEPHQTDSPSPTSDYTWCVFNGDTWSEGYWEPRTFTSEELKSWVVADPFLLPGAGAACVHSGTRGRRECVLVFWQQLV